MSLMQGKFTRIAHERAESLKFVAQNDGWGVVESVRVRRVAYCNRVVR